MKHPLIVINVQGGVVQEVFSSNLKARVFVLDWDTEGQIPGERGVVEVAGESGRSDLAMVVQHDVLPLSDLAGSEAAAALAAAGVDHGST